MDRPAKPIQGLPSPSMEEAAAVARAAYRGGRIRPLLAGSGVHDIGSSPWRRSAYLSNPVPACRIRTSHAGGSEGAPSRLGVASPRSRH